MIAVRGSKGAIFARLRACRMHQLETRARVGEAVTVGSTQDAMVLAICVMDVASFFRKGDLGPSKLSESQFSHLLCSCKVSKTSL